MTRLCKWRRASGCPLATRLWLRTVERRLQVLWALLAYGQQDVYSIAAAIAACLEKEPMALLPSVHDNAEALVRLWLVEAARPGMYCFTSLGVLVAWKLRNGDYCNTLLAARELKRGESLLRGLSVAAALAYVLAYSVAGTTAEGLWAASLVLASSIPALLLDTRGFQPRRRG